MIGKEIKALKIGEKVVLKTEKGLTSGAFLSYNKNQGVVRVCQTNTQRVLAVNAMTGEIVSDSDEKDKVNIDYMKQHDLANKKKRARWKIREEKRRGS